MNKRNFSYRIKKYLTAGLSVVFMGALGAFAGCNDTPKEPPRHTEHTYVETVVEPTCTEPGYTEHKCSVCGDTYHDNPVKAKGHTEGDPVRENEVASSCDKEGSYDLVIYCADCHTELSREQKVIDKHTFKNGVCVNCGINRDEVSGFKAAGYTFDNSTTPVTVHRTISNATESVNLTNAFQVSDGCEWKLYSDAEYKNEISDNTISLEIGHNYAYVSVFYENDPNYQTHFRIDVQRLRMFDYSFVDQGKTISSGKIEELTSQYAPGTAPKKDYYDFSHWTVNGERVTFPYTITGDVTFTSAYVPTKYDIEYELNGGEFATDYPQSYDIENAVSLKNPVKANYGFIGWYDNATFGGEPVTEIPAGRHGAVKYYAKWEASPFEIIYELDGGEFAGAHPENFTIETPTFGLVSPVKTNYSFLGWFADPEFKTSVTQIVKGTTGNVTLYARWLYGTDGLVFALSEDEDYYIVTGYDGTANAVDIPAEIYGVPVKEIGANAFKNNTGLTDVSILRGITTISDGAFEGCTSLDSALPETVTRIGSRAFFGSGLTALVLPEGLEFIGADAFDSCESLASVSWNSSSCEVENAIFSGCKALTRINIGSAPSEIPANAFKNCSAITEILIPETITKINAGAFNGCTSLADVSLHGKITNVGLGAFEGCTSLESITLPFVGNVKNSGANNHFGYIFGAAGYHNNNRFVPSSLKNVEITDATYIGNFAFNGCGNIESIGLNEGITAIGNSAFLSCASLKEIHLPESVRTIGNNAFQSCVTITEVEIPENVTSLGANAFGSCTSLTTFTSNSGLTSIGDNTFSGCAVLSSVTLNGDVNSIGNNAFLNCASLEQIDLPDSVATIGANAFKGCSSLASFTVKNGVTSIGANAFEGCASLSTLTLGSGFVSLASGTFASCTSLDNVTIPNNVTSVGALAFSNCTSLKKLSLSNNLDSIGANAFYRCAALENISFPSGLTSVGDYAFGGCSSFTAVNLPLTVTSIGYSAFGDCTSLASLSVPFVGRTAQGTSNTHFGYIFGARAYGDNIKNVPAKLNTVNVSGSAKIDDNAFYRCENIINLTLPSTMQTIGANAFRECKTLTQIIIPENVISVGNSAFDSCESLVRVEWNAIASEASSVGTAPVFGNCSSLLYIIVGNNVTSVPDYAFRTCASVTNVTLGGSLQTIGEEAFLGCNTFTTLVVPASVTSIGTRAFSGCAGINNLTFAEKEVLTADGNDEEPTDSLVISNFAFIGCTALPEAIIPDRTTLMGGGVFSGCFALAKLTLPFVGAERSETASAKSSFGYIFGTSSYNQSYVAKQYYTTSGFTNYYIPNALTELTVTDGNILFGSFDACAKLQSVTLPSDVTSIDNYAFRGCSSLAEIDVPAPVVTIGAYAFQNCSAMTAANFAEGGELNKIDGYAFNGCAKLENIHILANVTVIGQYAFSGCTSATELTFEQTVIGEEDKELTLNGYSFQSCSSLTSVILPDRTKSVAAFAFRACTKLTDMDLPFIGSNGTATAASASTPFGFIFGTTSYTGGTKVTQQWSTSSATHYVPNTLRNVTIRHGNVLQGAFDGCLMLTSITLPDTLLTASVGIGAYAFRSCTALTTIKTLSAEDGETFLLPSNITQISNYAFYGANKLDKAVIPAAVALIGTNAFQNCTLIGRLTLAENNSLTTINTSAFSGCTALSDIDFGTVTANGDGLEAALTIAASAFQNCTALKGDETEGFVIPKRITSLGANSFRNTGIIKLTLEDDGRLSTIDNYAFAENTKLTELNFGTTETELSIGQFAFQSCNNAGLTTLHIPARITSVGANAFAGCTNLTTVEFEYGSKLTTLGESSFSGCTSLSSFDFGTSETALVIGQKVFQNCTSLATITVPDNVTTIGTLAFSGCKSLTEMTLPFIGYSKSATANSNNQVFGYIFGNTNYTGSTPAAQLGTGSTAATYYIPTTLKTVTITGGNILQGAFDTCKTLTSITLPASTASIASLGAYAFRNCTALTELKVAGKTDGAPYTLPDNITSIGQYAFYGCNNEGFTSITLPEGVTSLGNYAFNGCSALSEIALPANITSIGQYAFTGCTSLVGDNTTRVLKIPAGISIININTFQNCASLEGVEFNSVNSIATIGVSAFAGCTSLAAFNLPEGVTSIGNNAFDGCTALSSFDFGTSETALTIGTYAFKNCSSLENITVPDNVTTIGSAAFSGCAALTKMTLPFIGNTKTATASNNQVLGYIFGTASYTGGTATAQLGKTSATYYIPTTLTTVTITGGNILQGSFDNCKTLTSITIPDEVLTASVGIGAYAFRSCTALTELKVAGKTDGAPYALPDNVTAIGDSAFQGCNDAGFTAIDLPASLATIGSSAFKDCTSLTTVNVADNSRLSAIGNICFEGCTSLTKINFSVYTDEEITVPALTFGATSFKGTAFEEFNLPANVTSIGTNAFQNCTSLERFNFAEGSKLVTLNNYAFAGCSSLTSFDFKASETALSIGTYVFQNCTSLNSIVIPERVTAIGTHAFSGCKALTEITLPFIGNTKTATSANAIFGFVFGTTAYDGSTAAMQWGTTNYYIPNGLTTVTITGGSVLQSAFYNCVNVTTITLPDGLVNVAIGANAFKNCGVLEAVRTVSDENTVKFNLPANTANIMSNAFENCSSLTEAAIPEKVTVINASLFAGCASLVSVTLPDTVVTIGNYAFKGCLLLNNVNIPAATTSIGTNAFEGCEALKELTFPSPAEDETPVALTIGNYAFKGCTALENVTLSEGVKTVGTSAFEDCILLGKLTIKTKVLTAINANAFNNTALTDVYFSGLKAEFKTEEGEFRFTIASGNDLFKSALKHYVDADPDPEEDSAATVSTFDELKAAVTKGGYVKLKNDITPTAKLTVTKNVVIDLSGFSYINNVQYPFEISKDTGATVVIKNGVINDNYDGAKQRVIRIRNSSSKENAPTVTLDHVDFTFKTAQATSYYAVSVGDYSTVNMNNCNIDGAYYGVGVFGEATLNMTDCEIVNSFVGITGMGDELSVNPVINLTNTDVSATDGAIYHPQMGGVTTINGGTFTSENAAAIEVRAGKVVLNNATVIGRGEFKVDPTVYNGAGGVVFGAAIAVTQHSTDKETEIEINGCTLEGEFALYEEDVVNDTARELIKITIDADSSIETATVFNGNVYSQNCELDCEIWTVDSVEELNKAIEKGAHVKLTGDILNISSAITVTQDSVIDLNEMTLSGSADYVLNLQNVAPAKVLIKNGTIVNEKEGGYAVFAADGAEVAFEDCVIEAPLVGIYAERATVSLNRTNVTSKYGVWSYGDVNMNGGKITAGTIGVWNKPDPDAGEPYYTNLIISNAELECGTNGLELQKTKAVVENTNITASSICVFTLTETDIEMTGCTLTSETGVGVQGNGTIDTENANCGINTVITLNECTINAADGIYHPQTGGILTVNGGTITATETGVEIRGGNANLNGVTITSTRESFEGQANNNGSTVRGAAVAISQHSTDDAISVTINGCTLSGVYALYEKDFMNETARENITIILKGENTLTGESYSENCDLTPVTEEPEEPVTPPEE